MRNGRALSYNHLKTLGKTKTNNVRELIKECQPKQQINLVFIQLSSLKNQTINPHIHQTHQSLKIITCYPAKSLSHLASCPEKSTNSLIHSKSTLRNHGYNHIIGTTQSWVAKTVNSHLWKRLRRVSIRRKIWTKNYQQFRHNQKIENTSELRFTFLTKTDRRICLQI